MEDGFESHLYGIETLVLAQLGHLARGLNRTFMELKLEALQEHTRSCRRLNRTFMELKPQDKPCGWRTPFCLNRTFMELKL